MMNWFVTTYATIVIHLSCKIRHCSKFLLDLCFLQFSVLKFYIYFKTQETKIIITHLIRVFDTTWGSTFWALKLKIRISWPIVYFFMLI